MKMNSQKKMCTTPRQFLGRGVVSIGIAGGVVVSVVGCANLLDIPKEPSLAEAMASEQNVATESRSELAAAEALLDQSDGMASGQSSIADTAMNQGAPSLNASNELDSEALELQPSELPSQTNATGETSEADSSPSNALDAGASAVDAAVDAGVATVEAPEEPFFEQGDCELGAVEGPNRRCFLFQTQLLPWEAARESCQALGEGWDLVSIRSLEVDSFVSAISGEEVWIGASDLNVPDTWLWVDDGSPFFVGDVELGEAVDGAYVNWNPTEPNGRGNSGCARTVPNAEGAWADLECEFERAAVCHGPLLSAQSEAQPAASEAAASVVAVTFGKI